MYFIAQIIPVLAIGSSLRLTSMSFDMLLSFVCVHVRFLILWLKCFRLILYFSYLSLDSFL